MKKTLALLLLLAGLTLEAQGRTLTWNGTNDSNVWDTTTANWLDEDGDPAVFQDGDDVVFDGFSIITAVELDGSLAPASVLVDSSVSFSFRGGRNSGSLTGSMQLTKNGRGVLEIYADNSYWGGTVLNDGTIMMYNEQALGGGGIKLNGGTLNLDTGTLYNSAFLQGSATIGNGRIKGNLTVSDSKSLTLLEKTTITGETTLGDNSTMDLGGNSIDSDITLQGSATIGNGTFNSNLAVGDRRSLTLLENTTITGGISLGYRATLDLGGNDFDSNKLALEDSVSIGNGTINSNLAVETGNNLTLLANTTITGGISLGDTAELNLGQNNTISGDITLGGSASLDLGQNTISSSVTLLGSASIGNGELNSDLAVAAGKELWLYYGDLTGSGTINLGNGATLLVGYRGYKIGCGISGSGTIVMNADSRTASLSGSMKDFSGSVEVQRRGTLNIMNIDEVAKLNVADVTIAANGVLGVYKGETAGEDNEGVLTITGGHKLTAGKDSRLNADLVMGGGVEAPAVLDVSANLGDGGLDMGSTVTLNPGSVLLSDADMYAIGTLDFMGKYDLFNGVDGLSLGGNFLSELGLADKWVKAADVFANPELSAEKDYYLFYSGVNQGGVGGNVGTVYLMQIPEPTTGTLSMLALAGLCMRRRRK